MKQVNILIAILLFLGACNQPETKKEIVSTDLAPAAIGPFSQAVKVGNTIFLSGQLGIDPASGKLVEGFEGQVRQALENAKVILEEGGFTLEQVVQCQVFVNDMDNYQFFNGIYQEYFKKDFPARALLEVSRIPADGLVEIMMVAVK